MAQDSTAGEKNDGTRSDGGDDKTDARSPLTKAIAAIPLRGIGPAFMGGRIADIAIHPQRPSTWFVAVGSGGVWKTVNAGTTWEPIFDDQPSFSIGCLAIDPAEPEVVWVGTGEAVSGRHVAWGNGVYRTRNGGKTWDRLGLDQTEHIGAILIDPRDSNTVYVAAEGPLWASGGERGVFKTIDGGATWEAVLQIDGDTGVTKLAFAPDNPDVLYAAAYQRRRHVATFVAGGPGSGIYKSTDGGSSWRRITEGLPKGDMGKIGLATTPADPNLVYATIEADENNRGFYRSTDRGESWEKRNDYLSGGTGPHYYQEIFASPVDHDRVYQVDVFLHVTRDGGTSFSNLETRTNKHTDNHVVWIDPEQPDHLLIGTDAGLYETFDEGRSYRHVPNLPISQFYRLAIDNSSPFYNVLGGAQDLGTLYGPSRTQNLDGIRNKDWSVPLGADGYHAVFDPSDPDICYIEWQVGNIVRYDHRTGERVDIQPQPAPGDKPERWNWDCPIVISPHDPNRLYVGSHRVWRSDDRGDSWNAISSDLTTDQNRFELPTFGSVPSVDALYDQEAMSWYSTITSISESSIVEGLLYVGTDDGLVQVRNGDSGGTGDDEDGGDWRLAARPDGLPESAFINAVVASEHDGNGVFLAADNHKFGDFTPYLYRSPDRGRTWESIRGDLPEPTIIWAFQQDHVNPELLFLGTEFGVWFSLNDGDNWHRLKEGVPTISFRDIKLHRRDDDLVAASFGRGFYVLDDYSLLRTLSEEVLAQETVLFPVRDAWWYVPRLTAQAPGQPTLGSTSFRTENPPFGAVVTYHLADSVHPAKKRRNEAEKELREAGSDIEFPGWQTLWDEHVESDPAVVLVIRDEDDRPVRQLAGETEAGLHRTAWDLRFAAPAPVSLEDPAFKPPWERDVPGPLVTPGRYSVELMVLSADGARSISERQWFNVVPTPDLAATPGLVAGHEFRARTAELARELAGLAKHLESTRERVKHLRATITATATDPVLLPRLEVTHRDLEGLHRELVGDPVREKLTEAAPPSLSQQVDRITRLHWQTTQSPTGTQRAIVNRVAGEVASFDQRFTAARRTLDDLAEELDAAGGTWTMR